MRVVKTREPTRGTYCCVGWPGENHLVSLSGQSPGGQCRPGNEGDSSGIPKERQPRGELS